MAHLLQLDASPRGERSHSRRLTREFVETWKQFHPADTVTYRDIGRNPIPHVDEPWIAAAFTPPEVRTPEMWNALRISEELINELLVADIYVMGIPMYNWSVTSGFKAYIDQIVRVDRTFAYTADETAECIYEPLIHGKKMFVIASRGDGGYAPGERNHQRDLQEPLIREAFGMIGITDITFVAVENDDGGQQFAASIATARTQIAELVGI